MADRVCDYPQLEYLVSLPTNAQGTTRIRQDEGSSNHMGHNGYSLVVGKVIISKYPISFRDLNTSAQSLLSRL